MPTDTVRIFDTTLRDGEQSPGIALNPHEKAEIAEQLERLGVDVIEAGFAAASPGDFEGVAAAAETVIEATIASLAVFLALRLHRHPDRAWMPAVEHRVEVGVTELVRHSIFQRPPQFGRPCPVFPSNNSSFFGCGTFRREARDLAHPPWKGCSGCGAGLSLKGCTAEPWLEPRLLASAEGLHRGPLLDLTLKLGSCRGLRHRAVGVV